MKTTNGLTMVRACTPADVETFPLRDRLTGVEAVYDWRAGMVAALDMGWYYVFEREGMALALMGSWPVHQGVMEINIMVAEPIRHYSKAFVQACLNVLEHTRRHNGIWRAQAIVRCEELQHVKFAEWFGFEIEGVLHAYGPDGADYLMMAKRWERP